MSINPNIKITRIHTSKVTVQELPEKAKPGSDNVGSATVLQRPPGINDGEAAGQHDQDAGDAARAASDEVPLAKHAHGVSAERQGKFGGMLAVAMMSQVRLCIIYPLAMEVHRRIGVQVCPPSPPRLPRTPCPWVVASAVKGGDSSRIGDSSDDLGKAPQQKNFVFIDPYPTDSVVRQKRGKEGPRGKVS